MEDVQQVQQEVILGEEGRKEGKVPKHHSPWEVRNDSTYPKKALAGRKPVKESVVRGTLGVAFCFAVLFRGRKTRAEDELG